MLHIWPYNVTVPCNQMSGGAGLPKPDYRVCWGQKMWRNNELDGFKSSISYPASGLFMFKVEIRDQSCEQKNHVVNFV